MLVSFFVCYFFYTSPVDDLTASRRCPSPLPLLSSKSEPPSLDALWSPALFMLQQESWLSELIILNEIRRRVQQDEEPGCIAHIQYPGPSKKVCRKRSGRERQPAHLSPKGRCRVETDISTKSPTDSRLNPANSLTSCLLNTMPWYVV